MTAERKKLWIFSSYLLWACRQGLSELPSNATQQGQRGQKPKSTHSSSFLQSWKFSVDPQMCNIFYCESAFTELIRFNCHEIGLLAVVLRHHNMLTPASPFFHLFLRNPSTILHFSFSSWLFFFQAPLSCSSSSRWQGCPSGASSPCWSPPLGCPHWQCCDTPVTKSCDEMKKSFRWSDLEKMGLHVVETGVKDQLKIRRVWHFWYKLILVHHLQFLIWWEESRVMGETSPLTHRVFSHWAPPPISPSTAVVHVHWPGWQPLQF